MEMTTTSNSTLRRSTSNSRLETTSPERSKVVWTEPPAKQTVPVVYYLSRNGQLQHPHFIEVHLSSSSQALFLRDVISRLVSLRGNSMPSMYSWSSKRSYKNGYVWNDLGENDFIYPTRGNEYVLKGSELLEPSKSDDSTAKKSPPDDSKSTENTTDLPAITRPRNHSSSSIDLQEYKVIYMTESSGELSSQAADASTQTDDKHRRHRATNEIEEETTELTRDEISPPPSESSPETLETPVKSDGKMTSHPGEARNDLTVNNQSSGRMKASTVLMQLLTCGSISFKNGEDHPGLSLVSSHGLPRGNGGAVGKKNKGVFGTGSRRKEDKEYFSGSLVDETNKAEVPRLIMKSSSHNAIADRRG